MQLGRVSLDSGPGARIQAHAVWQDPCFQPSPCALNLWFTLTWGFASLLVASAGSWSVVGVCHSSNAALDL